MDDPLTELGKGGWPPLLAAALLSGFGLIHGASVLIGQVRGLVRPPAKTDREILSEDQDNFLERVMTRLEAVEAKLDHCEESHALMARKFNQVLEMAKLKGVELAMDLGSVAPMPALAPIEERKA
jgi:hypothetical protein